MCLALARHNQKKNDAGRMNCEVAYGGRGNAGGNIPKLIRGKVIMPRLPRLAVLGIDRLLATSRALTLTPSLDSWSGPHQRTSIHTSTRILDLCIQRNDVLGRSEFRFTPTSLGILGELQGRQLLFYSHTPDYDVRSHRNPPSALTQCLPGVSWPFFKPGRMKPHALTHGHSLFRFATVP